MVDLNLNPEDPPEEQPIQDDEISSSSEADRRRFLLRNGPLALQVPANIVVPNWEMEDIATAHATFFRNITTYISLLVPDRSVSCTYQPLYYNANIEIGPYDCIQFRFREHADKSTTIRCNMLRHNVKIPTISHMASQAMLFDSFLERINYTLFKFLPGTHLVPNGYPRRRMIISHLIVEIPNPDISLILATWVPKFDESPRMIHVGRLCDPILEARFWECHQLYFTEVRGIECSLAPLHVALRLYQTFQTIHLYDNNLPLSLFFKWIKRWLMCTEDSRRVQEIAFERRGLFLNDRALALFLNYEPRDYNVDNMYGLMNKDGQMAQLFISRTGAIVFQSDETPGYEKRLRDNVYDDILRATRRFPDFPAHELNIANDQLDDSIYGPVEQYARHVQPRYQPLANLPR